MLSRNRMIINAFNVLLFVILCKNITLFLDKTDEHIYNIYGRLERTLTWQVLICQKVDFAFSDIKQCYFIL